MNYRPSLIKIHKRLENTWIPKRNNKKCSQTYPLLISFAVNFKCFILRVNGKPFFRRALFWKWPEDQFYSFIFFMWTLLPFWCQLPTVLRDRYTPKAPCLSTPMQWNQAHVLYLPHKKLNSGFFYLISFCVIIIIIINGRNLLWP